MFQPYPLSIINYQLLYPPIKHITFITKTGDKLHYFYAVGPFILTLKVSVQQGIPGGDWEIGD
jgi:hypothetical protein